MKHLKEQPGVGAAVFVTDRGGKHILLGKRLGAFAGTWAAPGGKVDKGETILAAARRELFEETGLLCDESLVFGGFFEHVGVQQDGIAWDWISFHYHLRLKTTAAETPVPAYEPDKCAEWKWFPLDALPEPLFASVPEGIQTIKDRFSSTYICDHCGNETAKNLWGPGWMTCPVCNKMARTQAEKRRTLRAE